MKQKNDQGSISLLILTISLGLLTLAYSIGFGLSIFNSATKLNNAADRVALAAATTLITNVDLACLTADEMAQKNNVQLITCKVEEDSVTVRVASTERGQFLFDNWNRIGVSRAGIDFAYESAENP